MDDFRHSRNADGDLTITNPNGVAVVSRTPNVGVQKLRPWMLTINDDLHDTYDTEEEAISAAHEILALKP